MVALKDILRILMLVIDVVDFSRWYIISTGLILSFDLGVGECGQGLCIPGWPGTYYGD